MMERYCLLNNIRKDLLPMSYEYYQFLNGLGIDKNDLSNAHFPEVILNFILRMKKMMILDITSELFSLKGN